MSASTIHKGYRIDLEPIGRRIEIDHGMNLLEATQAAGIELVAICGGQGICNGCRIRLVHGNVNSPTHEEETALTSEEINQGYRLACQVVPQSECKVDIPPESLSTPQRLQLEGQEEAIDLDPVVKAIDINVPPPNLHDLRSDVLRLMEQASKSGYTDLKISYPVLTDLSDRLRNQQWKTRLAIHTAVSSSEGSTLVAALPQQGLRGSELLGLAVDIGTTKLATYLVNLINGETLAKSGGMNPQIGYGEDVISRILVANERPDGRKLLQTKLIEILNNLIDELCQSAGVSSEQIVDAVVVGNTAMHHLFAGLPVRQLGTSPYVPSLSDAIDIRGNDLGLHLAPGAYVYLPPNIAGYVGADHVSMLSASEVIHYPGTVIALDIGTNTEVSIIKGGRILSCSCASGPAFEGAHITFGMRAAPGAIEKVQLIDGKLMVHTIGNLPPVGICGSGILDAVAVLLEAGAIDEKGNMLPDHPLVRMRDGKREVVLTIAEKTGIGKDIVVTRHDVNEIQLAKGAIRAGIEVLAAESGCVPETNCVDGLIVAGAFGTYLDVNSAMRVGMFPQLPISRFHQVGNAAGAGARQMLLSRQRRKMAIDMAKQIEYVELTTHPKFTDLFVKSILF